VPELPAPLPPDERTVGQVVAESIRFYGSHFWAALPLGIPLALADQASVNQHIAAQAFVFWAATPLFVAGYLWAIRLVLDGRITRSAVIVATLVWLPFPALRAIFLNLPGVAWLAFIGLAVPAAAVEDLGFRDALVRGRKLGTADYVHALGSLATLVIVVGLSSFTLSSLLHSQGSSGQRVAFFLSDVVLSPLLFLGGALLYVDQVARVGSSGQQRRSRRDADLHPPVDSDPAGRPDPQVEP
jgi:hypothetical protein